jgi:hypothetical protein
MNNLIYLREFIVSNFGIKLYGIEFKNKHIIYVNNIFKYTLCIFPFSLFNYINFINLIYKKDNIFYITNIKINIITPIILNCIFRNNNNNIDMTSEIKYYNSSIPFQFFINNNNLQNYNIVTIKYMSKGKIINKDLLINNYRDKLLYELFL